MTFVLGCHILMAYCGKSINVIALKLVVEFIYSVFFRVSHYLVLYWYGNVRQNLGLNPKQKLQEMLDICEFKCEFQLICLHISYFGSFVIFRFLHIRD